MTLSQHPRGDSRDDCIGRHVARDDGARADQGPCPDRDPGHDHGAAAERRPATDAGRNHPPVRVRLRLAVGRGSRVGVVDEEDAVPHEHLVLDRHAFADERVALNLATRAHGRVFLDLDERADAGVVADLATVQISERVKDDVVPQLDVRGDPNEVRRVRSFVRRRSHWKKLPA